VRTLLALAIGAYAVAFAALSVLRDDAFNTGRFDLGNMVQAVWASAHGHLLRVTDLHGDQISRLAAHVDPILLAFVPPWRIWPSSHMLLATQAVAVALGAIPVYRLAQKHLGTPRAGLGFALVYLLYPAVQWLTLNEFHPVALACPLLLYAIWYLDEERLVQFAAFAALAALTKEEVGLTVAGLGIWFAIAKRRRRAGAAIAVGGLAWALIAVELVIPHFNHGAASSFYSRYGEVGGSPRGVLSTALTHPGRLLSAAFGHHGSHYLLDLGLPLGFLFLASPLLLVAAVPELVLNLLSATPAQTSIHFHYTGAILPILVAASVLGGARVARRLDVSSAVVAIAAVVVALIGNYRLGAVPLWRDVPGGSGFAVSTERVTAHDRIAERALALIPAGAVVSATNSLGAHLSARRRVLSYPYVEDATWIAADETQPGYADRVAPVATAVSLSWLRRNPAWRLAFEEDGVLVFHRVLPP
jgi:uncharacterized membrane protein